MVHLNTGKRILLVEDDLILSKVESLMLSRHGYQITSVFDGENAVKTVNQDPNFDLILMDIDLGPGIDGTEAAQMIISKHDIPVLFLSGHTDQETVEKTEKITSYGYVVKNTGETVLLASIKMAFKLHEANKKLQERDRSLTLSEERFRNIINLAVDSIIICEKSGKILDVNLSTIEITGFSKEELLNSSFKDLFSISEQKRIPFDQNMIQKGEIITHEGFLQKKDQSTVLIEMNAKLMPDETFQIFIRNISERKKMETALIESERRFSEFMNYLPGFAYIKNSQRKILFVNQQFESAFGIPSEKWIGRTNEDIWPGEVGNKIKKDDLAVLNSNQQIITEERIPTKGELRTYYTIKFPIHISNGEKLVAGISLDITDRKKAEEALTISENKFASVFKILPDPMAITDMMTNTLMDVNQSFSDWSGFSREELIGKSSKDLNIWVNPSDRDKIINQLISGNPVIDNEIFVRRKDKSIRIVRFSALIFKLHSKNYLLTISHDITELKEAQEIIRQSEERFRNIVENSNVWFWETDSHINIIYTNQFVEKILGYTTEEFKKLKIYDITHPDDHSILKGQIENAIQKKQSWSNNTLHLKHKDGSWKIIESNGGPYYNKDGSFAGIRGVDLDITSKIETEKALKENQEIFHLFMEHCPVYVFFKDHNIRAIQLSRNYEKMLGMPLEKILGKTMDELFPSDLAKSMIEDDKKILKEGKLVEVVETLNDRIYSTIKFPIYREGNTPLMAGFTIDITDQKNTERKLSQALEEKKALLRELQHRIKNSLNLIASIIGLEISRIEETHVREILKGINSRIISLADLYNHLYKSDNVQVIRLDQYLVQVASALKKSYLHEKSQVIIHTSLDEMLIEVANAATLGLVLNELLTNALKYAFPELNEGIITINLRKEEGFAILEINNNGEPLPTDFDITQSSGLGLTLVQMLSDSIKGILTYKNVEEEGKVHTLFTLKFPYIEIL